MIEMKLNPQIFNTVLPAETKAIFSILDDKEQGV